MTPGEFLRDRLPTVLCTLAAAIFSWAMLTALGAGGYAGVYLAAAIVLSQALAFLPEYGKRRRFYGEAQRVLDRLDRKYLLSEVLPEADFPEGQLFVDFTRSAEKSMCDRVAAHERAAKEYREYIETWVHEIKTPIAAARLSLENEPDVRSLSRALGRIETDVEQALFYSRSGSVEQDYRIRETTLHEIVASALRKNAELLIEAGASIQTEQLDFPVFTDAKWTDFLLSQVLMNSVQYRSGPLRIGISGRREENSVALTLRDNGLGVSAADLPHVFDKGFTGENGRRGVKSTGLGLYLCKKLCGRMGLELEFASVPGEGAAITFRFPGEAARSNVTKL